MPTLAQFTFRQIRLLRESGKARTAETYLSALKSFSGFRDAVPLDEITSPLMMLYESHLRFRGVTRNTSSFYMRVLRAVYHRAVTDGIVPDTHPFGQVYTGVDKTPKRAVTLDTIRRIKSLELSRFPHLELARDLFLFSFYTRGMSFVDMAWLRRSDLHLGLLSYRRSKTGQSLSVKWERQMQEIVSRHPGIGAYLLPIVSDPLRPRACYLSAMRRVSRNLREVGRLAGLDFPLTMYVARHSWANAAKCLNVPIPVISEALGHASERTTRIYLDSFDTSVVDSANSLILSRLE